MKPKNPTITLLLLLGLMAFSANALAKEITCSSFEGKFNRCPLANANSLNVRLSQELEGECIKGETWGADSDGVWVDDDCTAVFTYEGRGSESGSSGGHCPYDHPGRSNECAYYRDGYKAGKKDRRINMSRAYERHGDAYDSRFEEYFAEGYRKGWDEG